MDRPTLYLVDGHSYIFRAYYAIPRLSTAKGVPTNAVYGFTNMLLKLIRERKPTHLAVAFDPKGPTERHRLYEAYKAQRPEMPQMLGAQIPYIHRIVRALGISSVTVEGHEADDVLATLARRAEAAGFEVVLVTGDKDLFQLLGPHVRAFDPMKDTVVQAQDVEERLGVPPEQVIEVMGLMGDAIDNIPGVPGIGEKTAKALIAQFGTIENLLSRVEEISKPKLRETLKTPADLARLSRTLATVKTDLPLEMAPETLRPAEPDREALIPLLRELEFTSLLKQFEGPQESGVRSQESGGKATGVLTDFSTLLAHARAVKRLALAASWQGSPLGGEILALAAAAGPEEAALIPPEVLDEAWVQVADLLADPETEKVIHDLKSHAHLFRARGIFLQGPIFDPMLASYLLKPDRYRHDLPSVLADHLSGARLSTGLATGSATGLTGQAQGLWQLREALLPQLEEAGLAPLFRDLEVPLAGILSEMEAAGILVDPDPLRELGKELEIRLEAITRRAYLLAGEEFNLNSPKQLAQILFEKLGLPPVRKTKTGYSTDVEVLATLARRHELPAEVLEYRTLQKLKSTYVDALPGLIDPRTGRIHTTFNQTATATGRLSSSDPNLQNIPIRTEYGKRIRRAFVAAPGDRLLAADYSQVELRILAHLSRDPILLQAFATEEDIHARTAAGIFGLPPEAVTAEMRRKAKTVNFGIIYGMSAFGLSADLGVSQQEAQRYIDAYFKLHQGVRAYIDRTITAARERGFVTTILGRRREVLELQAPKGATRSAGERVAINTTIHGSAADLIKQAMVRLHARLRREGLASRLILQIHDELILEGPEAEMAALAPLVREEMERAFPFAVPLKVDVGIGKHWGEIL
ncbi:MAG: DNA polymerase I [Nitrospirae bacterium]|nr:DNA polymerase I [Nitrospirota bacterium]